MSRISTNDEAFYNLSILAFFSLILLIVLNIKYDKQEQKQEQKCEKLGGVYIYENCIKNIEIIYE